MRVVHNKNKAQGGNELSELKNSLEELDHIILSHSEGSIIACNKEGCKEAEPAKDFRQINKSHNESFIQRLRDLIVKLSV